MADITTFPIPTEVLDPANYPEFVGPTGPEGPEGPVGPKGDTGDIFTDGSTIPGYSETGNTLTSVSEALTIPLDGKVHTCTLTEDVTVTFSLPASGRGSCTVNFIQDATGGWVVSFPATTEWADGSATDVDTTASTRTRAVFSQFSATGVDADLEVRGTAS